MQQETHENFARTQSLTAGTDRAFGLVMAGVFLLISVVSLWRGGSWWPWTSALAAALLAISLIHAALLGPLNIAWFKFGMLLHKIVNPLLMGFIFYGVVAPIGLLLRAQGKDLLRLATKSPSASYWIARHPPGPSPETMKDQF